jgi:hypothetical protein
MDIGRRNFYANQPSFPAHPRVFASDGDSPLSMRGSESLRHSHDEKTLALGVCPRRGPVPPGGSSYEARDPSPQAGVAVPLVRFLPNLCSGDTSHADMPVL